MRLEMAVPKKKLSKCKRGMKRSGDKIVNVSSNRCTDEQQNELIKLLVEEQKLKTLSVSTLVKYAGIFIAGSIFSELIQALFSETASLPLPFEKFYYRFVL